MWKKLSSKPKHKDILIKFTMCLSMSFIALVTSSCSEIAEDVTNCILGMDAEFETDSLPAAIVNQEYSAKIVAGINDTDEEAWYECAYEYEFTLEEGSLPDGLKLVNYKPDTFESYNKNWRVAKIEGTPTKPGEYKFKLDIELTPVASDCDDLCDPSASKVYVITVKSE